MTMHRQNGHATKKDPTAALDTGARLAAIMRPLYARLAEAAFQEAAAGGIAVAFDLDNPYVQTVLDTLARQVRGVAESTRQEIRDLVGRQAAEGWSMEELAAAIREAGVTRSATRATTIARTETAHAYTQGSLTAYRVSGVVTQVEWLTAADDRTCPICAPLNGARAPLDGAFAGGIAAPPAHPDCRCALAPVVEGS